MAQTTETIPEEKQGRPTESVEEIIEDIFALPVDAQLGVMRTVLPKILARLEGEAREGFLRDLQAEIDRAGRGEPSYDVRPDVQTVH